MTYELHLDQFNSNYVLLLYGSPEHTGATSSPSISVLGSKSLLIQDTVQRFLQSKEL